MLNKRIQLRSKLFNHLDGLVTAPVAVLLNNKGVIQFLINEKKASLKEISDKFNANEGYLNVALRVLSSQGFLIQHINNKDDTIYFSITKKGKIAFPLFYLYDDVVDLLKFSEKFHPRKFEQEPFEQLDKIFEKFKTNYSIDFSLDPLVREVQEQILGHIEGHLVGPTIVRLGMKGMFHKYFMDTSFRPEEFHEYPDSFKKILDFFTFLGWFKHKNGNYEFLEKGLFYVKRATAYGVTVSYFPTFRNIDQLIFGNPLFLNNTYNEDEKHVDREMNVWGSGGAHSNYFKVVDDIIIELFNRPINEQPRGILDMGCGNGAFLIHIYELIERQTLRGEILDEHPLFLVGIDYNNAALMVTRKNLVNSEIWAKVIWGDITKPDDLAKTLKENYKIKLQDLLNVRTFLDHNRRWSVPNKINNERISKSTGAYTFKGERLSNNLVEDNLLEHLKNWVPYVKKFGLLVIELHTIPPLLTSKNLGRTAATAYDATHGFSDQYIVEIEVFHEICLESGLELDKNTFKRFPDSDLATVSVNLLI